MVLGLTHNVLSSVYNVIKNLIGFGFAYGLVYPILVVACGWMG